MTIETLSPPVAAKPRALRGRNDLEHTATYNNGNGNGNGNNASYGNNAHAYGNANATTDSGNFVSSARDYANQIKNGTTDLATKHPREWSTNQILGVSTAIVALWTLAFAVCFCLRRRRGNGTSKDEDADAYLSFNEHAASKKHDMERPRVVRGSLPSHSSQDGNYASGFPGFDARDPNRLPLGARLHGAHKLREHGLTGCGVRVAVIDSGIDHTHPGFHDKVRTKRWFRHGTPLEEDDHGTHVAGTIHFLAPDADLYDYRVFGAAGSIDGDAAIAKSIRSAVDIDKCHVINMSLRCSYPVRPEVKKAVQHAKRKGVHMVCAAGNDGDGDPTTDEPYTFPARFDATISVAAVRKEKGLPPATFSESNAQVSYSGIGRDVVSLKPSGGFQTMSGTSMAAPHVTGLIACLLSGNPTGYSDKKLRALLNKTCVFDIGPKGYDKQTGEGFLTYLKDDDENDDDELCQLLSLVE